MADELPMHNARKTCASDLAHPGSASRVSDCQPRSCNQWHLASHEFVGGFAPTIAELQSILWGRAKAVLNLNDRMTILVLSRGRVHLHLLKVHLLTLPVETQDLPSTTSRSTAPAPDDVPQPPSSLLLFQLSVKRYSLINTPVEKPPIFPPRVRPWKIPQTFHLLSRLNPQALNIRQVFQGLSYMIWPRHLPLPSWAVYGTGSRVNGGRE